MAPAFDPEQLEKIQIALTYAKLYPSMVKDFMGKQDCRSVHGPGNMLADVQGSPFKQSGPVLHTAFQGGSDLQAQSKKAKYEAAVKTGDLDSILGALGLV